jgi:hypothetical protein
VPEFGKILVILGVVLALLGLLLWSGWGRGWLGHLPGDVRVDREGFSLRFPIVTCLLASLVISALLWLFRR